MSIYFTHRNRYVVTSRHLPPLKKSAFTLFYIALTLAKTIVYPLRGRSDLVSWMWKATLHGLSGRTGVIPPGVLPGEPSP